MLNYFSNLPRRSKRVVFVIADCLLLPLAFWAAWALRTSEWAPQDLGHAWWLFPLIPIVSLPIFFRAGLYNAVVRYMGMKSLFTLFTAVTAGALAVSVVVLSSDLTLPRSALAIYWALTLLLVGGTRVIAKAILQRHRVCAGRIPVVIYGAGSAGVQLVKALQTGREFSPVALLDDKRELQRHEIHGVRVYSREALTDLIKKYRVQQVLLALPSASRRRRQQLLKYLEPFPVHVRTLPGIANLVAGEVRVEDIREVPIEDLLGRDTVPPDPRLLDACIRGKVVMVTGAGGSIGSELCRQIAERMPARLVLFEQSEFAVYQLENELRIKASEAVEIVSVLGSVFDQTRVEQTMRALKVQTVYHAAAYKHVPLVEMNVIEGLRNNVFGTLHAAMAARAAGVETFTLISTDKAVRPTNVMGATKRLAEMVLQALAGGSGTRFTMVRFGNVLGSSGSVVPLFRQQIQRGGPVTVTHPEIIRYFMTIPEAAQLVLQASAMGTGGDVFVLDMGEPVRIVELAKRMIRLSGFEVRDETNPDGDIAVEFVGLRPGEKLYEELLIGGKVSGTEHPRIMRAEEELIPWPQLQMLLERLEAACRELNPSEGRLILQEAVSGYRPQGQIADRIWMACGAEREAADMASAIVVKLPLPSLAHALPQ